MSTDDWFWAFVERHCSRFPRGDWPELDTEYWASFRRLFLDHGVREEEADEASRRLFEEPPGFPEDFPKALLAQVRLIWREARAATTPICPGAAREDHSSWDARAEAHWSRVPPGDRDGWLALAAERLPCWRPGTRANLLLAIAWAYDPGLVVDLPPPPEAPASRRGPRRVFDGLQPPKVS